MRPIITFRRRAKAAQKRLESLTWAIKMANEHENDDTRLHWLYTAQNHIEDMRAEVAGAIHFGKQAGLK